MTPSSKFLTQSVSVALALCFDTGKKWMVSSASSNGGTRRTLVPNGFW